MVLNIHYVSESMPVIPHELLKRIRKPLEYSKLKEKYSRLGQRARAVAMDTEAPTRLHIYWDSGVYLGQVPTPSVGPRVWTRHLGSNALVSTLFPFRPSLPPFYIHLPNADA